ncbi:hypothetical protein MNBD_CHLOROFLEXI01-1786 [hydrothermal vent metagenome]|uniref:Trypsin-like peptidase domain-containing protein n=1 Tax=hydrothermal vent metagenome TaxID=652676 RepID=A0A3B0WG44_9ZZZZ
MPKIHPVFFDCVFYMYPSVSAAESSEMVGGSGFLVSVPAKIGGGRIHLYAVTNKHVVDSNPPSTVIRMNTRDGQLAISDSNKDDWERHPVDDIAVTYISVHGDTLKYSHIPIDSFVTEHMIHKYGIGPGDNVFMVGRFVSHEGKRQNIPSLRFGNISMMHDEPMQHPSGNEVESFAVEMRSVGGYSGSPVFVYFSAFESRPDIEGVESPTKTNLSVHGLKEENAGPLLLGVDWGHIPQRHYLFDPATGHPHPNGYYVQTNSNMASVAPAWKLQELLNTEKLVMQREISEKEELEKQQKHPPVVLDFVEGQSLSSGADQFTRDDFMNALGKSSTPIQPDSKKKGT